MRAARVELSVVESDSAESLLSRRERPLLVFSTHSGEGDSLLVLHQLVCRHERRPRIVLHEALRIDPLIDLLGSRLRDATASTRVGNEINRQSEGNDHF